MIRKYNKWNVYIHNMAKFDMIFLLKSFSLYFYIKSENYKI
jgi:hypothetical protein